MKAVIAIVAVLIIAGGGYALVKHNDNNKGSNKTTQSTSTSTDNMSSGSSQSGSTAPEATNSVTISNFAFSPASITVKKGTTVTWINKDSTGHTVTETDGKDGPNSKTLANGDTYSFTYNATGTFAYKCSIHSGMTGTVTATE